MLEAKSTGRSKCEVLEWAHPLKDLDGYRDFENIEVNLSQRVHPNYYTSLVFSVCCCQKKLWDGLARYARLAKDLCQEIGRRMMPRRTLLKTSYQDCRPISDFWIPECAILVSCAEDTAQGMSTATELKPEWGMKSFEVFFFVSTIMCRSYWFLMLGQEFLQLIIDVISLLTWKLLEYSPVYDDRVKYVPFFCIHCSHLINLIVDCFHMHWLVVGTQ